MRRIGSDEKIPDAGAYGASELVGADVDPGRHVARRALEIARLGVGGVALPIAGEVLARRKSGVPPRLYARNCGGTATPWPRPLTSRQSPPVFMNK